MVPKSEETDRVSIEHVATFNANLMSLGFVLSPDVVEACVKNLTKSEFDIWSKELSELLIKYNGSRNNMKPMYPNFPQQRSPHASHHPHPPGRQCRRGAAPPCAGHGGGTARLRADRHSSRGYPPGSHPGLSPPYSFRLLYRVYFSQTSQLSSSGAQMLYVARIRKPSLSGASGALR